MAQSITIGAKSAFFWSDTHFCHRSAAKHRGFGDDIDAMDRWLVAQWNASVGKDDTVFLLGDVSFAGTTRTLDQLRQLNGKKVLVRGNHDKALNNAVLSEFDSVHDLLTVKVQTGGPDDEIQRIVCCHFPMLAWDMAHYGAWHLHGHSHGSARYPWERAKILDVGVDTQIGAVGPVPFWRIRQHMDLCTVQTADNHIPKVAA